MRGKNEEMTSIVNKEQNVLAIDLPTTKDKKKIISTWQETASP